MQGILPQIVACGYYCCRDFALYYAPVIDPVPRGTHGYMAPEVLSKGTAYDSSADWFSFGCMLYKLLKGHSPFRQHKTKDKHEIDRMTLTMVYIILIHEFLSWNVMCLENFGKM